MNYLERRAQQRVMADLESRLTRIAGFVAGKRKAPERTIANHAARFAVIVLMLTSSSWLAWLLVEFLKALIPHSDYPGFYVGLAVASAATLVAFFKELGDLIVEFWSVESPSLPNKLKFFVRALVALLPLFLATYATKEYFASNSKSEVNLFLSSMIPASSEDGEGLFRFNIVFGDPRLDGGEAGWRALLYPSHVSVAIGNDLHRDFLSVLGRRLRACGATSPVEVDVVGYFSSTLWKINPTTDRLVSDEDFGAALKAGGVQVLDSRKKPGTIFLDRDGRRQRLEQRRAEIEAIRQTEIGGIPRAADTARAFNLWVAEQRASAVCRALLGLNSDETCNDVVDPAIRVVNVTKVSSYDDLAKRLDRVEPQQAALTADLDPDFDERVLARSAEIIIKSAGSCEIPVSS